MGATDMSMPKVRPVRSVQVSDQTVTFESGVTDRWSALNRVDLRRLAATLGAPAATNLSNVEVLAGCVARVSSGTVSSMVMPPAAPPVGVPITAASVAPVAPTVQNIESMIRDIASGAAGVDHEAVQALIDESLRPIRSALDDVRRPVQVVIPATGHSVFLPDAHHVVLPQVVQWIAQGIHVFLSGPAGSGKSTIGVDAAAALGRDHRCVSVGPADSRTLFYGYMSADGQYVSTVVREMYEFGGVLVIDEIDNGHPAIITALNMLLANGECAFPDGMVAKHADFVVVATGNTWGRGADQNYVGTSVLNAATLDRFVMIPVDYDESLELALALSESPDHGADWCAQVQAWRKRATDSRLQVVISPRATIFGARMLAAGMTRNAVAAGLVFNGLNQEAITTLQTVTA